MKFNDWVVGPLTFSLPMDLQLEDQDVRTVGMPGPPGGSTTEWLRWSWRGPSDSHLAVDLWRPYPPFTGAPMVAAQEFPVMIAGTSTLLVETAMFDGIKQRVLVAYADVAGGKLRIVARGMEHAQVEELLARIRGGAVPTP